MEHWVEGRETDNKHQVEGEETDNKQKKQNKTGTGMMKHQLEGAALCAQESCLGAAFHSANKQTKRKHVNKQTNNQVN